MAILLDFLILRPCNNLILYLLPEFNPVLSKPSYPNHEPPVFIRLFLSLFQHPRVYHIELYMKSSLSQVSPDKFQEFSRTFSPFYNRRMDLHIEL